MEAEHQATQLAYVKRRKDKKEGAERAKQQAVEFMRMREFEARMVFKRFARRFKNYMIHRRWARTWQTLEYIDLTSRTHFGGEAKTKFFMPHTRAVVYSPPTAYLASLDPPADRWYVLFFNKESKS